MPPNPLISNLAMISSTTALIVRCDVSMTSASFATTSGEARREGRTWDGIQGSGAQIDSVARDVVAAPICQVDEVSAGVCCY